MIESLINNEIIQYYLLLLSEYYQKFLIIYNDPKSGEMFTHCAFAIFVVGVIALPNFVCKVSD